MLHEAMELRTDKRAEWGSIDGYRNITMSNIPNDAAEFSKIKATRLGKKLGRGGDEGKTSE